MRKDDYKLHLDKIKCSDEFRRKMEELLSAEQEEIYAESVTTVERAGRINIQRWSGLAASAVLLAGIGGLAVHTMKDAPEVPPTHSGESDAPIAATGDKSNDEAGEYYFSFENNTYYRLAMGVEGELPDELAEKLIERINSGIKREYDKEITAENDIQEAKYDINLFEHDSVPNTECKDYVFTICSDTDEDLLYKVSNNNIIFIADNGEESLYFGDKDLYGDINKTIAENIFSYDWKVVNDEYSEEYSSLLNKYRDEIVRSDLELGDDIIVLDTNLPFITHANKNGTIQVYYSIGIGSEIFPVTYQAPVEFVTAVYELMDENYAIDLSPEPMNIKEKLNSVLSNSDFNENSDVFYGTGQGQFSKGFEIGKAGEVGGDELIKLLADYEWVPAEDSDYMRSDFIRISYQSEFDLIGISVNDKGELYDNEEAVLYRAENADISALQEQFQRLLRANDEVRVAYNLCTRADNFTTLESEVSIYYNPLDETGENKPVNCTGMLYLKNQTYGESKDVTSDYYMVLNGDDSDYSGEFYKKGRYWAFVEKNGSIAKGFFRGDRDFEDYRLFTRDNYIASGGYDNYDAINIDYDNLYNDAFYTFTRKDDEYMNVLDYNHAVGQANDIVKIEYIEQYDNTEVKNDYSEILEFKVNGMGALVYYSRSRKNLETGEIEKYLEFKLCDGVCLGMGEPMPHFDPIYFAIPSTSEELAKEFELINET
ncbi:MAG: hypothetical protein IJN43_04680 [Ruminococcus sp.]|nr:hypothetical protein [Ruminococcus sp.]